MEPIPDEGEKQVSQSEVRFLSAVILLSPDPDRLAHFYRTVLGVPLEADSHAGEGSSHYECELGDVHFAIHFSENGSFSTSECPQKIKFALAILSVERLIDKLAKLGLAPLYPPIDRGFAVMTAIRDPDDNLVELTQLSNNWLSYLERRKSEERSIVDHWKATRERNDLQTSDTCLGPPRVGEPKP